MRSAEMDDILRLGVDRFPHRLGALQPHHPPTSPNRIISTPTNLIKPIVIVRVAIVTPGYVHTRAGQIAKRQGNAPPLSAGARVHMYHKGWSRGI